MTQVAAANSLVRPVLLASALEEASGTGTGDDRAPMESDSATGYRVLVVDDSRLARKYLEAVLLRNGLCADVFLGDSTEEGLEILRMNEVDLVLCDVKMPGLGGLDFLAEVRSSGATRELPVIMLTAEDDFDSKLECLESGASDYLLKPFAEKELIARARIHLQLKELRDELMRKNKQLTEMARLDPLTGIPNRHHFFKSVERELNRANRTGRSMAVAMIDVDHFKRVNDDFGHLCGDQALVKIAQVLRGSLRDYDLLGRYGGEEFAAVIVESDAEAAVKVAERCRRRVAEQSFTFAGTMQSVTVSIGVSFTSTVCAGSLTEMIARADEALYLAKNRGRDQVVLAASDLVYVSEREKELEL